MPESVSGVMRVCSGSARIPFYCAVFKAIFNSRAGGPGLRNALLLLASVVFYVWGGKQFIYVLIGAALFNYLAALAIERCQDTPDAKRLLGAGVVDCEAIAAEGSGDSRPWRRRSSVPAAGRPARAAAPAAEGPVSSPAVRAGT